MIIETQGKDLNELIWGITQTLYWSIRVSKSRLKSCGGAFKFAEVKIPCAARYLPIRIEESRALQDSKALQGSIRIDVGRWQTSFVKA